MSKKRIIALGFGILLTGLFVYFSLHPYNPGELPTVHMFGKTPQHIPELEPYNSGELPTVHMFAYGCMLKTDAYLDGYLYSSEESATQACHHNLRVSLLVIGCGAAGIPLLLYSLRNGRKRAHLPEIDPRVYCHKKLLSLIGSCPEFQAQKSGWVRLRP